MFKKVADNPVDEEDPWSDDKLNVKPMGQSLCDVLSTIQQPTVVSVSAPFGMGKTYFAKRIDASLRKDRKFSVYFNAWETDFSEDPFLVLVTTLANAIQLHIDKVSPVSETRELSRSLRAVVKSSIPMVSRMAINAMVNVATAGLIKDAIDSAAEIATSAILTEVQRLAEQKIASLQVEKASREEFKKQLIDLNKSLFESQTVAARNIFVIVDEIDRCRPPYALRLLEAARHLFNVEGYFFVLLMNEDVLEAAAASQYGHIGTGERYLSKFVDWRVRLPNPSYRQMARHLFDSFRLSEVITDEDNTIIGVQSYVQPFAFLAQRFSLSLRSQSQVFSILNLVVRRSQSLHLGQVLTFLCIAREVGFKRWRELPFSKDARVDLWTYLTLDPAQFASGDEHAISQFHDFTRIFLSGLTGREILKPEDSSAGLANSLVGRYSINLRAPWEHVAFYHSQIELWPK